VREKDADLLFAKQWDVASAFSITYPFVPTIDHNFLNKNPLELLKSGEFQKKNILLGVNSHEGSFFVLYTFPKRFDPLKDYNENITNEEYRDMVKTLRLDAWTRDPSPDVVYDAIASVYSLSCGSEDSTGDDDAATFLFALDGMLGDVWFKCPVVRLAKAQVNRCAFYSCL